MIKSIEMNKLNLYRIYTVAIMLLLCVQGAFALEPSKFTHKIVAGYYIGATAPTSMPREVRSVDSYWPQFTPQLGYNVSYDINHQWGVETGITLDLKGMGVRDKVKYMYTDVTMDKNNVRGYFTGKNETTVKASYVTVPVRVTFALTPTWKLRAGGYFAYRNSSEFSGTVWDGYLRQTDDNDIANSTRIEIENKNEATFDFGKDMRNFDMGISLGFEHNFQNFKNGRFSIYTDMTVSLTPIFPSSFTGVDMTMRHMYGVVGLSYKL